MLQEIVDLVRWSAVHDFQSRFCQGPAVRERSQLKLASNSLQSREVRETTRLLDQSQTLTGCQRSDAIAAGYGVCQELQASRPEARQRCILGLTDRPEEHLRLDIAAFGQIFQRGSGCSRGGMKLLSIVFFPRAIQTAVTGLPCSSSPHETASTKRT